MRGSRDGRVAASSSPCGRLGLNFLTSQGHLTCEGAVRSGSAASGGTITSFAWPTCATDAPRVVTTRNDTLHIVTGLSCASHWCATESKRSVPKFRSV